MTTKKTTFGLKDFGKTKSKYDKLHVQTWEDFKKDNQDYTDEHIENIVNIDLWGERGSLFYYETYCEAMKNKKDGQAWKAQAKTIRTFINYQVRNANRNFIDSHDERNLSENAKNVLAVKMYLEHYDKINEEMEALYNLLFDIND